MNRLNLFAALFFTFWLGFAVRSDWSREFGAEYAFAAWLYFVITHLIVVAAYVYALLRDARRSGC